MITYNLRYSEFNCSTIFWFNGCARKVGNIERIRFSYFFMCVEIVKILLVHRVALFSQNFIDVISSNPILYCYIFNT